MSDTLGSASSPVESSNSKSDESASKCPVDFETRSLWGLWGKKANSKDTASQPSPASLEEAAKHAQTPHPDQRLPLSTHRLESTIPRSNHGSTPGHQIRTDKNSNSNSNSNSNNTWVYPSEQQVFNAMKRKGWTGVEEESIPSFLQIHNSVNERSWKEVQKWEERSGVAPDDVQLSRFEGRPKDLTPKAWILSTLGLSDMPFDRHDWYVVHSKDQNPVEQRYVLDFYMTNSSDMDLPRVEIDVRPALDSPRAIFQRGQGLLREAFPGIARELDGLRKT